MRTSKPDVTLLEEQLAAISTKEQTEALKTYLQLERGAAQSDDTRRNARRNTAEYKRRTALKREPSSQHIVQATAYAVFSRYGTHDDDRGMIVREVYRTLLTAGFAKDGIRRAMTRFLTDIGSRRDKWVTKTLTDLQLKLVAALIDE